MKAVVMERYGPPDVLELRDVATPTPTTDQVLVRVHAASGKLVPVIDRRYGLAEVPEALRLFGTGTQVGKIIVTMA